MRIITRKKKNSTRKWSKKHEFQYKKADGKTPRHPSYIVGSKKTKRKYLIFTSHPSTNGTQNILMSKNIDPYNTNPKIKDSYVRDGFFIGSQDEFEAVTDKKFRIDKSDLATINKLKKKPFGKK